MRDPRGAVPDPDTVLAASEAPRAVDLALKFLTQSANHGKLWLGLAAVGVVVGGKPRRAGLRGIASLAGASFVSNSLVKPMVGRRRPDLERTRLARRIGEKPWTSSFPSGHSASAAAFAVGAAMEFPLAAIGVVPLAAAVAYSRVHVGVHYRSDVIAGAAVGAGVAVLIKKLWEVREHGPADSLPANVPAMPQGAGLTVVVNRASGSATGAADEIRQLLPSAVIVQWDPEDGPETIADLVGIGGDVVALGVAGGDGTVAAVAGVALEHQLPLAVFAAGTLNHFAKALGLNSFADTAAAVEAGVAGAVDVAEVEGVPFLNTASVGMYPELVRLRDRLSGKFGKWPAAMIALPRVLKRATPIEVVVNGNPMKLWTIFVGNGHYTPRGLVSSTRDQMSDGQIDVQFIYAHKKYSRLRAVLGSLVGQVERSGVYGCLHTDRLELKMVGNPLLIAHDGEVDAPRESAVISVDPERLVVFRAW
ncbi:phosphatase PAP2 family protein [Nakamurella antarctica]|uniref:Phosphatase PAP2 family protein n=1 Tax=Nakamurella antarctica TaxID=1902245 RepID=A0A3G8ZX67_9ACTN|nr:phosphatase PAP2 family protein [Nakamurella antarctica]AZI58261.1 phosphatase PAP2 family protein [Nakamurella antarctica]